MIVDKDYCMNSFLQHRTIIDKRKAFYKGVRPRFFIKNYECDMIHNSKELGESLRSQIEEAAKTKNLALFLSGGVDSAVLARYMPRGSVAYTFKCVVPGKEVQDETPFAKEYAKACGLEHRVVDIYWEDFEKYVDPLMLHKGSPLHSIEIQLYKASLLAKKEGFDCVVIGESADLNYGGLDGLLSQDWTLDGYAKRFTFVDTERVLVKPERVIEPFLNCVNEEGRVDVFKHFREWFMYEALGSYENACSTAGIDYLMPYSRTWLNAPLDIQRIRNGDNKYLVRELFRTEYAGLLDSSELSNGGRKKLPMPRPMNEWMENWEGPKRSEFLPDCVKGMSGDQKWLIYSLERFLNLIDHQEKIKN